MATNKNITMKQFNGVDYDTLYPKTIASQVEGLVDPFGPWKYGGKVTSIGEAGKVVFYTPKSGETFSSIINQLCVCVNSLNGIYSGSAATVNLNVYFGTEYANTSLNRNIYFSIFTAYMNNDDKIVNMSNSKFLFQKVGFDNAKAYYYPSLIRSAAPISKDILLQENIDIDNLIFYVERDNGIQVNSIDMDLYYR
jgi:hypothetical protein